MEAVRQRFSLKRVASGWDVMAETLEQFVHRRRLELDVTIRRLEAALDEARAERARVDAVASDIGASEQPGLEREPLPETRGSVAERASEPTIKEMVRNVLKQQPSGMSAVDILSGINRDRAEPFARTSLSPQLSRLKAAGEIHLEGRLWKFGPGATGDTDQE